MAKISYSLREGLNPNARGFSLSEISELFVRLFNELSADGYTHEAFGFYCVDNDDVPGSIRDVEFKILMTTRKKGLWPPAARALWYSEDDLFDVIEFIFDYVSKPLTGWNHDHGSCGMHWETFSKIEGQREYRKRINDLLSHYKEPFELSEDGMILKKAQHGYEPIFAADVPTKNSTIQDRVAAAVLLFRRHGSSLEDRRHAVADLAGVLEAVRPQLQGILTKNDEADLFNIANNFLIRHHNDKQKTSYDAALWLSWMFYLYLSTVHLVLRKIEDAQSAKAAPVKSARVERR